MTLDMNNMTVLHWFPNAEVHRCGYCKSQSGSVSYGMWAETMTVNDYQNLIDRGWRRSGRYCYKPIMDEICCPQYTIRCDALNFKISKSQRKIIKKFNKYLNDGLLQNDVKICEEECENKVEDLTFISKERPNTQFDYNQLASQLMETTTQGISGGASSCSSIDIASETCQIVPVKSPESSSGNAAEADKVSQVLKKGIGPDPNKLPCKKAKLLRREKKQQKMLERGVNDVKTIQTKETKSVQQLLSDIPENGKHKLTIKLVRMKRGGELFSDFDVEYELYQRYQMIVHNDPPEKCSRQSFTRFLVNTPLKVKLERMNRSHDTFQVSYELYAKYQMFVHGDRESDCDVGQFVDFLVDSPLKADVWGHDGFGFGSFHQQYWIDRTLVAVGVIDILPKCVSSVYFFYDPNYRSLTLGTYGSLREIDFTCKLHQSVPSIRYYYMGFYIHSCLKMRYKGKLIPSDLLCPETYKWFPITQCLPKLEQNKYSRFNEDSKDVDENACTDSDIDHIKIFMTDGYVKFKHFKYRNSEREVYRNVGKLIGKKCIDSLLFIDQRH